MADHQGGISGSLNPRTDESKANSTPTENREDALITNMKKGLKENKNNRS